MTIGFKKDETRNTLELAGAIDISSAAELKTALLEALREALSSGKEVSISLDAVTYLDVTAVQLLWAAGQEARRSGSSLQFRGPLPPELSSALADAGFSSFSSSVQAG